MQASLWLQRWQQRLSSCVQSSLLLVSPNRYRPGHPGTLSACRLYEYSYEYEYPDSMPLVRVLCYLYPPFYATCTSSMPLVPPFLCHLYPPFHATCTYSMPFVPPFLCHLYPHYYATCTSSMPPVHPFMPFVRNLHARAQKGYTTVVRRSDYPYSTVQ